MREKLVDSDPVRRGGHPVAPDLPPRGTEAADVAESSLVEALQRGNEEAAALLVHRFAGRLLAVARRILRNEDDAQDALQDAFLSAFRSIADFRRGARLSTWLHRIVVNAALMRLRSRKRHDRGVRRAAALELALSPGTLSPEQRLGDRRNALRALAALGELEPAQRDALVLRALRGLDYAQIAKRVGVSPQAVKTRVHRARRSLLERLSRPPPTA